MEGILHLSCSVGPIVLHRQILTKNVFVCLMKDFRKDLLTVILIYLGHHPYFFNPDLLEYNVMVSVDTFYTPEWTEWTLQRDKED